MRRFFTIGHRHLPTAGGAHACRHSCCPRRFLSASLPSARSWGWGVATVPPQPAFSEVNQDDNHSWYANRD
jgi:hypothetical protein